MAKNSKMITCKHCGAEIAKSAKTCPHCGGKNKKPFYKKVWFWILIILLLAMAAGGGSKKQTADTSTNQAPAAETQSQPSASEEKAADPAPTEEAETEVPQETEAPQQMEAPDQTEFHVGDTLPDGDLNITYVASGDYEETNEYLQPGDGNKYIFLKFAFANTSSTSDRSINSFDFECYADGYAAEQYFGGEESLSATLSAGRSAEGTVYFEVPADAEQIEIEYETNWFTNEKVKFLFEGDLDSGYVSEKNTSAAEDALKVGDTLEGKTLNIKYLSVQEDSFDNMFMEPKDGFTYVTCELEFENVSASDVLVSSFSFDCFADGIACDSVYYRDDSIDATLSPGRKAKGTVTFEVPKDATIVEVEYLTNYWTSNRVVFDASNY